MSKTLLEDDFLANTAQDNRADEEVILGVNPRYVFFIAAVFMALPYVVFLCVGYSKLYSITSFIEQGQEFDTRRFLQRDDVTSLPHDRLVGLARIYLDFDAMTLRHKRASIALETRTWMRFMSIVFGAMLVLIGATFVLGRVSNERFDGSVKAGLVAASLKASSPGLALVLFGVILILAPNFVTEEVVVRDGAAYMDPNERRIPLGSK